MPRCQIVPCPMPEVHPEVEMTTDEVSRKVPQVVMTVPQAFAEMLSRHDESDEHGDCLGCNLAMYARKAQPAPTPDAGSAEEAACYDCKRPYSDGGFHDLVVPNDVWKQVSPTGDEGGMLCPSCLCKRLSDADIETTGTFRSGPFARAALAAEARRDELEAALREIADGTTYTVKGQGDAIDTAYGYWRFREIARAALRTEAR